MTQPLYAIALHQPHGAGVKIRPDGLAPETLLGQYELFSNEVERGLPARIFPGALALRASAHQRI